MSTARESIRFPQRSPAGSVRSYAGKHANSLLMSVICYHRSFLLFFPPRQSRRFSFNVATSFAVEEDARSHRRCAMEKLGHAVNCPPRGSFFGTLPRSRRRRFPPRFVKRQRDGERCDRSIAGVVKSLRASRLALDLEPFGPGSTGAGRNGNEGGLL